MAQIYTTLNDLFRAYGNGKPSGRFPCPVTAYTTRNAPPFVATHIYRGFGATRLERIEGQPNGKKGFQGEAFARPNRSLRLNDDFLIND